MLWRDSLLGLLYILPGSQKGEQLTETSPRVFYPRWRSDLYTAEGALSDTSAPRPTRENSSR
jgi:hypothetical protein